EGSTAEQGQGLEYAATGFQCFGWFQRPVDSHAPTLTATQVRWQKMPKVALVDDDVLETRSRQGFDVVFDQGLATGLEQRLGQAVGQGPQPLAAAGGQDHGAHCRRSSQSFMGLVSS